MILRKTQIKGSFSRVVTLCGVLYRLSMTPFTSLTRERRLRLNKEPVPRSHQSGLWSIIKWLEAKSMKDVFHCIKPAVKRVERNRLQIKERER